MLRVLKYLKHYWKSALLAPILMLIEVYTDLLQPQFVASIVDNGIMTGDLLHVQQTGAKMVGVAFIGLIGGVGCGIFATIAAINLTTQIRKDLFDKVQTFSFRNLETFSTGSLITRLTNDLVQIQNFVQMLLRILVRAPFLALGSLIMAFLISYKLALILVIVTPILAFIIIYILRKGLPLFSKVQQRLDKLNSVLRENFAGIPVVKAFVRSTFENERFKSSNNDYMEVAIKASVLMATIMPVMLLILNGSIVAVLWFGGLQSWNGTMQIGELVAFINYVTQVLFSLLTVSMILMNVSRAKASADRIAEVLDTESEIQNTTSTSQANQNMGKIRFDNVSFAYNGDEQVLRNIHFSIESGETVAIIGATGSGKSTLVNLIPRFYEASKGNIYVNGTNVRNLELHELRSKIGIVLQQAILFSGSIIDNIRYGRPNATIEEVVTAAKIAQAHEFISQLPDGYETHLGQRGVNLSGGQKQRISLARALLIQPEILILDDSTSAVDLGTEAKIQAGLKENLNNCTCITIAQRITSIVDADNILVMDEGMIVAEGTHEYLLKNSSIYQEVYQSQVQKEEVING